MLPFGSITSIIPLFVLAIAYVLFAAASLLNKLNPVPASDSPGKEIVIKTDVSSVWQEKPLLYYTDIQAVSYCTRNLQLYSFTESSFTILIDFSPEILYSGYPNQLFSRPPPSSFFQIIS